MISCESEWIAFEATGDQFEVRQLSAKDYYQAVGQKDVPGWEQTCALIAASVHNVEGVPAFTADEVAGLPMPVFALFSDAVFRLNRLDLDEIKKKFGITAGCLNSA